MSFLVVDYRGYGQSDGKPTASSLLSDAHPIFRKARRWLERQRRTGLIIVMGRSLGSVPALDSFSIAVSPEPYPCSIVSEWQPTPWESPRQMALPTLVKSEK
jgi:hypothetical protein